MPYFYVFGIVILDKGRQQREENLLSSKITLLGSILMFFGMGTSFLASRFYFEDCFGHGQN